MSELRDLNWQSSGLQRNLLFKHVASKQSFFGWSNSSRPNGSASSLLFPKTAPEAYPLNLQSSQEHSL